MKPFLFYLEKKYGKEQRFMPKTKIENIEILGDEFKVI